MNLAKPRRLVVAKDLGTPGRPLSTPFINSCTFVSLLSATAKPIGLTTDSSLGHELDPIFRIKRSLVFGLAAIHELGTAL
jgi:hypothetical protein